MNYNNIKYIVSPNIKVGTYWARTLNIALNKIKIIHISHQACGTSFTKENTLILLGEKFDYPEDLNMSRHQRIDFDEMLEIVTRRIRINSSQQSHQ